MTGGARIAPLWVTSVVAVCAFRSLANAQPAEPPPAPEAQEEPAPPTDVPPDPQKPAAPTPPDGPEEPDVLEPWAKPGEKPGEAPKKQPPDWGLSGEDVVSPWKKGEGPKPPLEVKVDESAEPWDLQPGDRPAEDVKARFDVGVGDRDERRVTREPLVPRGMYDRPYLTRLGSDETAVALGGYVDMVGGYLVEEGVSDGFEFEVRRFNLFVTSRIADLIRLTSEIEFEPGEKEIHLEIASVDILFHHAFNLRAGILLAPLGKFNLAHDPPLYEVIDRPLVSTMVIPSTLSEAGGGFFGAFYPGGGHRITYEAYVVGGLADGVIAGEGTRLSEGRRAEMFAGDNNGSPAVTARLAFVSAKGDFAAGEVGFSGYAGVYNSFRLDGLRVDEPRWLSVVALDGELVLGPLVLRGEGAVANVDVPPGLGPIYARTLAGMYVESVLTYFERSVWLFDPASLAAVVRADWIDLNRGRLLPGGETAGERTVRVSAGMSFRPDPAATLRVVYQHNWIRDLFNGARRGGGVQIGLATYF